jgi:predicted dehydrogenase
MAKSAEPVRIGVIGCGKIAEKHLNAYRKLEGVEITVTDIVPKGEAVARRYSVGWHPDPDVLITSKALDAVDVCIPTPAHTEAILKALDAGKHVFCEKPLARNLPEALQIERKVEQTGRVVMVGYLYRFHPAFQFAREVLQEEILGKPYFALFRLGGRGSHKAWKHKREAGGGAGNEMLVHMLDLALWYFGDPRRVEPLVVDTVLGEREIEGKLVQADAEDLLLLRLESKQDVKILCESDLITPSYINYIEIQGTNGSLWTSILDYFPTILYCKEPRGVYDRGNNVFEFPKVDLFERELGHFLEALRDGRKPELNSVEESVHLMRILESALEAKSTHD